MSILKVAVLAAAVVAAISVFPGCGQSSDTSDSAGADSELITPDAKNSYEASTPQRVALDYLQAIQFRNVDGVLDFYAKNARPQRDELASQLAQVSGTLTGVPEVVETTVKDDYATILLTATRNGRQAAFSVRLVKDGGKWAVANNDVLDLAVTQLKLQQQASTLEQQAAN